MGDEFAVRTSGPDGRRPGLIELLRAVAVYAAGGRQALLASGNAGALKLLEEIKEG